MLQLEEARERIVAAIQPLPPETISLADAGDRFTAHDITAPLDLPPFDNSAMDGYAVRSEDLKSASQGQPVSLNIVAHIPAGGTAEVPIKTGTCARIFTGSALPSGADAVVMQEDVRSEESMAHFHEPITPWENVRFRGEDMKAGSIALKAGDRLTAGAVAVLGALGLATVSARRQPMVGILSTGNELQDPGKALSPGQIYESNRLSLAALTRQAGGVTCVFPVVPDNPDTIQGALKEAFAQCDLLVTSGGVSVGELDFVKDAFQKLGGQLDFWRVAIRPGKPFAFGTFQDKYLFGLPGNPVSAFVTFLLLVWPAIRRLQGTNEIELPSHLAIVDDTLTNKTDRRHFVRVRMDSEGYAHLSGVQASHALSSLAQANGLVDVPARTIIERGTEVRVLRFA
jgi:molybdopterin molybdotransferase